MGGHLNHSSQSATNALKYALDLSPTLSVLILSLLSLSSLVMALMCGSLCQDRCSTPCPERSRVACCCGCSRSSSTWASMSNRHWLRGGCRSAGACAAGGFKCLWSCGCGLPSTGDALWLLRDVVQVLVERGLIRSPH